MSKPVILVGDSTSHGGTVQAGSQHFLVDGKGVARVGDKVSCPIHGDTVINRGSETYVTDGKPTARDGDTTACGGTLHATQNHYLIR